MTTSSRLALLTIAWLASTAAYADVAISKKPTVNMNCSNGVCSPTASDAVLNVSDLANMLASGDVRVTTGSGATNIVVKDSVGWATTSRLTFDANQSVTIDKPVMVTGTGAVTVTTNDGGSGGDLIFDGKGNVTFWDLSSSLIVNGNSYTLVGDIATLASDIANNSTGFYALANDYDASVDGTYDEAPVTTGFTGTFEGLGHAIDKLTISGSADWVGLFRLAGGGTGTLRDVGLLHVNISGTGSGGGGALLGASEGTTIVGCYATGSVSLSGAWVGGLIGGSQSEPDGILVRSRANVSVKAPSATYAGGLIGLSYLTVSLSSASGNVVAGNNAFAGGLAGFAGWNIAQSYATGRVSAGASSTIGGLAGEFCCGTLLSDSYATGATKSGEGSIVAGLVGIANSVDATISTSYSTGHVDVKNAAHSGGLLGEWGNGAKPDHDYWDRDTTGENNRQGCDNRNCPGHSHARTTQELQAGLQAGFDPNIWGLNPNINGGLPYLIANPR